MQLLFGVQRAWYITILIVIVVMNEDDVWFRFDAIRLCGQDRRIRDEAQARFGWETRIKCINLQIFSFTDAGQGITRLLLKDTLRLQCQL